MAQNITLLGASYSSVPSVLLPKTGGGTAAFTDVSDTTAAASDVASGKYFYAADGTRTLGTNSGGGGSVTIATTTATASNYPVSLEFSSLKGQPKMFVCRLNAQVSSSGSTTYYYIVDISMTGSGTAHGNCFRIGSTRRVDNITSGYTWSYSGTTLTLTSSATSRSASPGAFYSGSYELIYVY